MGQHLDEKFMERKHEMPNETTMHVIDVARVAARKSKRITIGSQRVGASVMDLEDLEQESIAAGLAGTKSWDGNQRTISNYTWKCCTHHLMRYCAKTQYAVSAKHDRALPALRKIAAAPLVVSSDYSENVKFHGLQASPDESPESLFEEKQRIENIRAAVEVVFGRCSQADADIARRVIMDGEKPHTVASSLGIPTLTVYRVVCRARRLLSENAELFSAWKP